jgi:hypothetical protein
MNNKQIEKLVNDSLEIYRIQQYGRTFENTLNPKEDIPVNKTDIPVEEYKRVELDDINIKIPVTRTDDGLSIEISNSPALERLIKEVEIKDEFKTNAYNRVYNRHNR